MIFDPQTPYHIVSVYSGKAVAVADASLQDGGHIHQTTPCDTDDQQWALSSDAAGYYTLMALHSRKYLEVGEGESPDGASVHQGSQHHGDRQKWQLVEQDHAIFGSGANSR